MAADAALSKKSAPNSGRRPLHASLDPKHAFVYSFPARKSDSVIDRAEELAALAEIACKPTVIRVLLVVEANQYIGEGNLRKLASLSGDEIREALDYLSYFGFIRDIPIQGMRSGWKLTRRGKQFLEIFRKGFEQACADD